MQLGICISSKLQIELCSLTKNGVLYYPYTTMALAKSAKPTTEALLYSEITFSINGRKMSPIQLKQISFI